MAMFYWTASTRKAWLAHFIENICAHLFDHRLFYKAVEMRNHHFWMRHFLTGGLDHLNDVDCHK